jgi:hypothetical protein
VVQLYQPCGTSQWGTVQWRARSRALQSGCKKTQAGKRAGSEYSIAQEHTLSLLKLARRSVVYRCAMHDTALIGSKTAGQYPHPTKSEKKGRAMAMKQTITTSAGARERGKQRVVSEGGQEARSTEQYAGVQMPESPLTKQHGPIQPATQQQSSSNSGMHTHRRSGRGCGTSSERWWPAWTAASSGGSCARLPQTRAAKRLGRPESCESRPSGLLHGTRLLWPAKKIHS